MLFVIRDKFVNNGQNYAWLGYERINYLVNYYLSFHEGFFYPLISWKKYAINLSRFVIKNNPTFDNLRGIELYYQKSNNSKELDLIRKQPLLQTFYKNFNLARRQELE